MLDRETKRKIDSARDILVGKIPDPKSQVEQITISLIYKFMDDMDKESVAMGGSPTFFTGDFEQYGWSKIFDPRLGGFDMLTLYSEAIIKMNQNPNIPQLFRDIFKNAFLPYRDPQTLELFLKQINEFHYDHSERLGDAFEYLLSVMSSQGDAGQFRTPRHIIDFIVQVVDPKKHETVCDPACGTAGFLISSYKHILKHNTKDRPGDTITPDGKKRLINNFVGYDIASDMVRLSLVNMYLHGFSNPRINEYDTLTSEDKWNETFDAILANPPFMTPKGGIRPHKRFSVQAKRSEVLFVAYIAEHLNPNGRAGVIVPEGIIFQSQNAYKQLRKMLVDNYLYAVVSLPAGVFNPYSGVKTSILLMDKNLSKKIDSILFVNVAHDGYDLGAQRKPIDNNDLPRALEAITNYKNCMLSGKEYEKKKHAHSVLKSKIADNGEYSLSGDRYIISEVFNNTKWNMVKIGEIAELGRGRVISKEYIHKNSGHYPVYSSQTQNNGEFGYINTYDFEGKYVTWTTDGANAGRVFYRDGKFNCTNVCGTIKVKNCKKINPKYLALILNSHTKPYVNIASGNPKLMNNVMEKIKIPLPPLGVQQEIVAEIEGYQKIIDGARQIVENWKPTIKIDPDWEMVELGKVADVTSSKRIFQNEYVNDGIPFYRTKEIVELNENKPISLELFISEEKYESIKSKFDVPEKGDILISAIGTIGISWVISDDRKFYFKDGNLLWIKDIKNLIPKFLKYKLDSIFKSRLNELIFGTAYKALTIIKLKEIEVPLPNLEIQKQIIKQIESEQEIVEANKKLIAMYERKIKERIDEVWGLGGELY